MSEFLKNILDLDFTNTEILIDQNHDSNDVLEILKNKISAQDFKPENKYYLTFKDNKLSILFQNQKPIYVDFLSPSLKKIFGQISKNDIFCKAIGLKDEVSCVYDLTAGFGSDTFVLSKFVNEIVWVERNSVMCLLLNDGLRRLEEKYSELSCKFKIIYKDGLDFINENNFEINSTIYFDFMFENKKSKSNKEMSFLKHITKNDSLNDVSIYINRALKKSKNRVVLKTKILEEKNLKPKHIYKGKTVQYFVFK